MLLIFLYRLKTLFKNKGNVFALLVLPAIILACLWVFGRFYAISGQRIPVGVTDNDESDFSKLVIERVKTGSAAITLIECT